MEKRAAKRAKRAAKRAKLSSSVAGVSGQLMKKWEKMDPYVLGFIFSWMPTDVMVRTVPLVCRSWRDALIFPFPWMKMDVRRWCDRVDNFDIADDTVQELIFRRSYNLLNSFKACNISNLCFYKALSYGKMLTVLKMPNTSVVTDDTVEQCARFLPWHLTTLDISCCPNITYKSIELFGKQAKRLVKLKRNMPKLDDKTAAKIDETEAFAVAHYMPGLQHLELRYNLLGGLALEEIADCCRSIRHIDVSGCPHLTGLYDFTVRFEPCVSVIR